MINKVKVNNLLYCHCMVLLGQKGEKKKKKKKDFGEYYKVLVGLDPLFPR